MTVLQYRSSLITKQTTPLPSIPTVTVSDATTTMIGRRVCLGALLDYYYYHYYYTYIIFIYIIYICVCVNQIHRGMCGPHAIINVCINIILSEKNNNNNNMMMIYGVVAFRTIGEIRTTRQRQRYNCSTRATGAHKKRAINLDQVERGMIYLPV